MKRVAGSVLAMALLAGCAGGPPRVSHNETLDRYLAYAGEPVDRATAFQLYGWEPVDRNKLVLWTDAGNAFLVTVWDTCPNLQFANQLRVVTKLDNSLSRFDEVRVDRSICPFKEIRPIDVKRMKANEKMP